MRYFVHRSQGICLVVSTAFVFSSIAQAQQPDRSTEIIAVPADVPLHIRVTRTAPLRRGAVVEGLLTEPVYVYDRIVLPKEATDRLRAWLATRGTGLAGRSAIVQRRNLPGMVFVKFVVQFVDLHFGLVQSLPARSRDLIEPATVPSNIFEDRLHETAAFLAMQKWVESSRPDAIPVMRQFLHHCKAEDGLLGRM
jgi:hypothetical protein